MRFPALATCLVACLLAASTAGEARAADDWNDLADKAKANIAETRTYVSLLKVESAGWSSDLARNYANVKGDEYASHVPTVELIQKASIDIGKLVEALESDQALLDALQSLVEKGARAQGMSSARDRAPYVQSLDAAFTTLKNQDIQAVAMLDAMQSVGATLKKQDSQLRALLAETKSEALENDLLLNSLEIKSVTVGARLADLVHTLLLKSMETLRYQVGVVESFKH